MGGEEEGGIDSGRREEVFADIRVGERERGVKVVGGRERDGVEFAAG